MSGNVNKTIEEISMGVNVNIKGYKNLTALDVAAQNGELESLFSTDSSG